MTDKVTNIEEKREEEKPAVGMGLHSFGHKELVSMKHSVEFKREIPVQLTGREWFILTNNLFYKVDGSHNFQIGRRLFNRIWKHRDRVSRRMVPPKGTLHKGIYIHNTYMTTPYEMAVNVPEFQILKDALLECNMQPDVVADSIYVRKLEIMNKIRNHIHSNKTWETMND